MKAWEIVVIVAGVIQTLAAVVGVVLLYERNQDRKTVLELSKLLTSYRVKMSQIYHVVMGRSYGTGVLESEDRFRRWLADEYCRLEDAFDAEPGFGDGEEPVFVPDNSKTL